MSDPTSIIISTKTVVAGLAAIFGINAMGWKLFTSNKLEQIKDHEIRLRNIENNFPKWKYVEQEAKLIHDHLDSLSTRIDKIYELQIKK